jgi:HEAT repeat protein
LKAKDPALRIAAAETMSRMDWRATPGIPALIDALKDHETKVRVASARALGTLASYSKAAVTPLASALPGEPEATARAAFLEALEAIAPGSPAALDAHRSALHDTDSQVRTNAVSFQRVPTDDSWVAALGSALGDPADLVRLAAARSLAAILFEHPAVIPTLTKALGDEKQNKAVQAALLEHLEKTTDMADFGRARGDLARLQVTLGAAIPALRDALKSKNEVRIAQVFSLLGRIVAFSRLSRNLELRKAIEPALETYLQGLDDTSPEIRQEVLARLDAIPIRRTDVASALIKYLERSNLADEDRQTAVAALAAQAAFVDSTPGMLDVLKPGIALLAKALDSPEAEVREAAVRALGYIGNEARTTADMLRRLARNDSEATVRKTAESAIKAINGIAKMPPPPGPGGMGGGRL